MNPLTGFAPDRDPTLPGVITDCAQLVPTERGMKSAPSAVGVANLGALADECRGAAVLQNTIGSRRTFAGTQTDLYELASGTWADVSGATYTGSSENRWSFAQFGNVALATNDSDQLQYSTATTFAAVPNSPKARILVSVPNFVIALNTQDGASSAVYGDSSDRWWCCAFQNPLDWAPDTDTQCATGRLIGGGGEITAGAQFGSGLVVYKAREMFLGVYAGPPTVFDFQRIPGDQGCVGPEAVIDIGGAHAFVGEDNIWIYDGSRAIPIGADIRQWFYDDLSPVYRYRTIVNFDRNNGRIWIFYPSTLSTGNPDAALVYHLGAQKWGRANRTVEAALSYVTEGLTWDTLSSVASTWDALPDQPWDSQAWQAAGRVLAVFDTSHNLKTLTGSGENSGFTTNDFGSEDQVSFIDRVRLKFFTEPTIATITGQTKTGSGVTGVASSSGTMTNSKFDVRQSGKWHRFSFLFTGNTEVAGIDVRARRAGGR